MRKKSGFSSPWRVWIESARPRTLFLALASVGMGSFLATVSGHFNWTIALLTLFTATFLQILSNLANDYGDSIHGADHGQRVGPSRAVQSGLIKVQSMRLAIPYCPDHTAINSKWPGCFSTRSSSFGSISQAVVCDQPVIRVGFWYWADIGYVNDLAFARGLFLTTRQISRVLAGALAGRR